MKRIIPIICALISLTGCKKILDAAVESAIPDPVMAFKADGEQFTATWSKDSKTLLIINVADQKFAIRLAGSNWETRNTLKSAQICINCGFFDGKLVEGVKYAFSAEEIDTYPYLNYVVTEQLESSVYRNRTMWYNASDGWITITNINKKRGILSGKFEFTAVCDDPSNEDIIEITKGAFRYIPYKILED